MNDVSLKTSQVAALLGCCERTVLRMCQKGLLKPTRIGAGRQRRYSMKQVMEGVERPRPEQAKT